MPVRSRDDEIATMLLCRGDDAISGILIFDRRRGAVEPDLLAISPTAAKIRAAFAAAPSSYSSGCTAQASSGNLNARSAGAVTPACVDSSPGDGGLSASTFRIEEDTCMPHLPPIPSDESLGEAIEAWELA
jgi:hypothetical protein